MRSGDLTRRMLAGGLFASGIRPVRAFAANGPTRVVIATDRGDIVVELATREAPITTANFLRYVDRSKYDGGSFFRRTRPKGAPGQGTIVGAPPRGDHPFPPIAHESTRVTGLRHKAGTISLGRFGPGSATSNFFICVGAAPAFDAHTGAGDTEGYAAFGRVVSGMAVVRKIHAARADGPSPYPDQKGEWLNPPVKIRSMRRA